MAIAFLLSGLASLFFLISEYRLYSAPAQDGEDQEAIQPAWGLIGAASGMFVWCVYSVYPLALPPPGPVPAPHGPFKGKHLRCAEDLDQVTVRRLLVIVNPVSGNGTLVYQRQSP